MRKMRFNKQNTYKPNVPNKPGIYRFYDKNGKMIYVGHSKVLRHRLQSYQQKDCPIEHNEKVGWRKKIHSFTYTRMPREKAMKTERKIKTNGKYNFL